MARTGLQTIKQYRLNKSGSGMSLWLEIWIDV